MGVRGLKSRDDKDPNHANARNPPGKPLFDRSPRDPGYSLKKIGLLAGLGFVLITLTRWLMRKSLPYPSRSFHSSRPPEISPRRQRLRPNAPHPARLPQRVPERPGAIRLLPRLWARGSRRGAARAVGLAEDAAAPGVERAGAEGDSEGVERDAGDDQCFGFEWYVVNGSVPMRGT